MARNIKQVARKMNAEIIGRLPETGGGVFGAARLSRAVKALREKLQPGQGVRPGRPTAKEWDVRSKVPMSSATQQKLRHLARQMSTVDRKISPMQVAAQLLEEAVAGCDNA